MQPREKETVSTPLCSGLTQADPFPERDILAKGWL